LLLTTAAADAGRTITLLEAGGPRPCMPKMAKSRCARSSLSSALHSFSALHQQRYTIPTCARVSTHKSLRRDAVRLVASEAQSANRDSEKLFLPAQAIGQRALHF